LENENTPAPTIVYPALWRSKMTFDTAYFIRPSTLMSNCFRKGQLYINVIANVGNQNQNPIAFTQSHSGERGPLRCRVDTKELWTIHPASTIFHLIIVTRKILRACEILAHFEHI